MGSNSQADEVEEAAVVAVEEIVEALRMLETKVMKHHLKIVAACIKNIKNVLFIVQDHLTALGRLININPWTNENACLTIIS